MDQAQGMTQLQSSSCSMALGIGAMGYGPLWVMAAKTSSLKLSSQIWEINCGIVNIIPHRNLQAVII